MSPDQIVGPSEPLTFSLCRIAFIRFSKKAEADAALEQLAGYKLPGTSRRGNILPLNLMCIDIDSRIGIGAKISLWNVEFCQFKFLPNFPF